MQEKTRGANPLETAPELFSGQGLGMGVFHHLAHVNKVSGEAQKLIGAGVSGKPVLAINPFPVGYKHGDKIRCGVFLFGAGVLTFRGFSRCQQ
jgi:hypothetical protein